MRNLVNTTVAALAVGGLLLAGANAAWAAPATVIDGDGVYRVGIDIEPGTYYTGGGGDYCYWERQSGLSGDFDELIANDFIEGGPAAVTIKSSDVGFSTDGCGTWAKQAPAPAPAPASVPRSPFGS